jgi:hypothetical protein
MVRGEAHTGLWWGNLKENNLLKDLSIDGRIILKWIFKKWDGGMEWIDLAQKRVRWRTFVNPITNLRVP